MFFVCTKKSINTINKYTHSHTHLKNQLDQYTMRACFLLFLVALTKAKKITKAIDVEGLKLDNENGKTVSESVQFKFKLNKRDRPELNLLVNSKWIPLKVTIDGKNEVVTVLSKRRNGGWKRRGI